MSCYWYLECLEHDPVLSSGDEFTQHTDDDRFRAAMALAARRPLPAEWWEDDTVCGLPGVRFLAAHPWCRLEAVSETDERRPVPSGAAKPGPHGVEDAGSGERFGEDGSDDGGLGAAGFVGEASDGGEAGGGDADGEHGVSHGVYRSGPTASGIPTEEQGVTTYDERTNLASDDGDRPNIRVGEDGSVSISHLRLPIAYRGDSRVEGRGSDVPPPPVSRRAVFQLRREMLVRLARYVVPEGARLGAVWSDPMTESIYVVAEHDSFDVVHEGAKPPRLAADDVSLRQLQADVRQIVAPFPMTADDVRRFGGRDDSPAVDRAVLATLQALGVPFRP